MKRFFLVITVAVLGLVGCTKESGNEPVVNSQLSGDTEEDSTKTDKSALIVGTWTTTEKAYSAVGFYYRDGSYCDTMSTSLEGMGFTFRADSMVETPWTMTNAYVYENDKVVIDVVEGVQRVYEVKLLTNRQLVMLRRDTADYYVDGDTVVGYEVEYWDMERNK